MRQLICISLMTLAVALCGCDEKAGADAPAKPDAVKAMEGGDPIPARDMQIFFPWMGKQNVMCVGDAFERQVAFADFSDVEGNPDAIGQASIKADGTGTAKFTVPAKKLRSGDDSRNKKLMGGAWLDAETHPNLTFEATKLEKKAPTVWKITGTWTMRGIGKEVSFLANVRWLPKMKYVSDHGVVRIKGAFDINLKQHGMDNGAVGTPAVAEVWTVEVVLLGVPNKE